MLLGVVHGVCVMICEGTRRMERTNVDMERVEHGERRRVERNRDGERDGMVER